MAGRRQPGGERGRRRGRAIREHWTRERWLRRTSLCAAPGGLVAGLRRRARRGRRGQDRDKPGQKRQQQCLPLQELLLAFLPRLFAVLTATAAEPAAFVERYRARCGLDGQPVTVFHGAERVTGICRGIAADGSLVVDTPEGRRLFGAGSLTDPDRIWPGA